MMDTQQPLCAWCHKIPAGTLLPNGMESHGICRVCSEQVIREHEISKLDAIWRKSND